MHPRTSPCNLGASVVLAAFLSPLGLVAESSSWTASNNGTWSNAGNWSSGVPAQGVDAVATFQPTGASPITVTNDIADLTLGGIAIAPGSTRMMTISGRSIRLQTTTGTPSISFNLPGNAAGVSINSALSGEQGFTVTNAGTHRLQINGSNPELRGTVTLNSGSLVAGNHGAFGTANIVMNGGTLNAGIGRPIANNILWNGGVLSMDTTAGSGASGATFKIEGAVTLGAVEGALVSSSVNAGYTQFFVFDGVVSSRPGGKSLVFNNGNVGGNVFVQLNRANSFAHQISLVQGGANPPGGLGKHGSVGLLVGHDAALSSARVTIQSGVSRFVLASTDATARTLANEFVWQTHENRSGASPAFEITFGAYTPVGADFASRVAVASVGGSGDLGIGSLEVNANSGGVAATHRRLQVTGQTTATIKGVFSRSGSLPAASVRVEKTGAGTLVLANAGNTYDGGFSVAEGTLMVEGLLAGTGVGVSSGAAIGGDGRIATNLDLFVYAGFVFTPGATLTVDGAQVTFGGFGVSNLIGLTGKVAEGTYTLIEGTATIDPANLSNVGAANATDIGEGKAAYLNIDRATGDLQLVVVRRRA